MLLLRLRAHHCHPAPPSHRTTKTPHHRLSPPRSPGCYCICGKLLVLAMPNCIMDICLSDKYAIASMPRPPATRPTRAPSNHACPWAKPNNNPPGGRCGGWLLSLSANALANRLGSVWFGLDRDPGICTCKYFLLGEFWLLWMWTTRKTRTNSRCCTERNWIEDSMVEMGLGNTTGSIIPPLKQI